MRDLKVGDRVNMFDGSYAFGINKGQYSDDCSCFNDDRNGLTILEIDLRVTENAYGKISGEYTTVCDILVTNGNGGFWFTRSRFLRLCNGYTITIDGKEITISEKSYQELKRSLV